MEQRLNERPSRDFPTLESIHGHYYGCQEVLGDRNLVQLSPERLFQNLTYTEVDTLNQTLLSTGYLMKEVENGHKELKEFAVT